MVKQTGLLAAGCQIWNNDSCAASRGRFAYSATLAIYVFELDTCYNEYQLVSIMSEHKRTITALAWSPHDPDVFATASQDGLLIVWNVAEQRVIASLSNTQGVPKAIGWCFHDNFGVGFTSEKGPLHLWSYKTQNPVVVKEASGFTQEVCNFRWHHHQLNKVVFGHVDGSLSVITMGSRNQHKHILCPEVVGGQSSEEDNRVVALEWDRLSDDYLLVANLQTGVRLVDTSSLITVTSFCLPSAAAQVKTLAWVPSAPGMFITGDKGSGVLRVWNVSRETPIENIRIKRMGFQSMQVVPTFSGSRDTGTRRPHFSQEGQGGGEGGQGKESQGVLSSTSLASVPAATTSTRFSLPHAHVVCTFRDGGIGLYDLGRRKWQFLREQGHFETIFDCKFKPDNSDLLATASFDGSIKVWDINTMTAVQTTEGNEGVIYQISWAPADLNCIVACTSTKGVFIWSLDRGKIIKRFQEHGKGSVYSVSWNQKNSKLIASCGNDGNCIIREASGSILQKYKHPAAVFGSDWSPHNADMIATGCADKCLRVFYLSTGSDQPLKTFTGHTERVFHVRWSPLREGVLCSGSDDRTVRVWDYTQDGCMCVLNGHTAPVRGLVWNTEVPYLIVSGSWDSTIRVWDTRDGACVDTILDHGADVYGLTSHPDRPFLLASSSRDSTVRLWSLTDLVQPIELNLLAQKPWQQIVGTVERAMSLGTAAILTGKSSRDLKLIVESKYNNSSTGILQCFSKFFSHPMGTDNLWDLVTIIKGGSTLELSPGYSKGILHTSHLTQFKASEAQELEMIKMSKFGGGVGAPTREDRLKDAAAIHIRNGNIQRYCEMMVELGEWEKALIAAPGVSMKYWKNLAQRYTDFLVQEDKDEAVSMAAAVGNTTQLVEFLAWRGQLADGLQVAQAACEGAFSHLHLDDLPDKHGTLNGVENGEEKAQRLLRTATSELADWHLRRGSPILAACCHLSINDFQRAMSMLIRGGELEMAVAVGRVLGNVPQMTALATEYLARRCEEQGRWQLYPYLETRELAIDLLATIPNSALAVAKLCARCAASMDEINLLHEKAGLPSMDACLAEAERCREMGQVVEAVKFFLLSTLPEQGMELGLADVKSKMSREGWTADDVFDMLQLLGCIKTERLQQHRCEKMKSELLALSAYVGALVAVRRHYYPIVPALLRHTRQMLARLELSSVPVSGTLVELEQAAWNAHQEQEERGETDPKPMGAQHQEVYTELLRKAGKTKELVELGPDYKSCSNLPSHSDVHVSCLTGQRIQGLAFFLEDVRSALSINEALMWAKVNPFSPIGSGVRINPF